MNVYVYKNRGCSGKLGIISGFEFLFYSITYQDKFLKGMTSCRCNAKLWIQIFNLDTAPDFF